MRFLSLFCFSPASFSTQNAAYEIYFHRIINQLKCLLNDNISESGFRILLLHIEMQFRCSTDQLRHFLNSLGWLVYHQIIIMRFLGILNNYLQHIGALHLQMSSLTIFFLFDMIFFLQVMSSNYIRKFVLYPWYRWCSISEFPIHPGTKLLVVCKRNYKRSLMFSWYIYNKRCFPLQIAWILSLSSF